MYVVVIHGDQMSDKRAKIGEEIIADDRPSVFELILDDHVIYANPKDYDLKDIDGINPYDYFVTSGDAVQKAKVLEKNMWEHAGNLRKLIYQRIADENQVSVLDAQQLFRDGTKVKDPARLCEYEKLVWKAAGKARRLHQALVEAKGSDCFLETEWDNHILLCIPKNPRK